MRAQDAATHLRAYGDPTRLRIIDALSHGPLAYSDLARVLECPKPRLTRHLRYLHARGFVQWSQKSGAVVYRLSRPSHLVHERMLEAAQSALGTLAEVQDDRARRRALTAEEETNG
jgi:predicted ArsR family transcriptional regulator